MRILIAITSSISAYKIPVLVSMLKKQGHEIICAITKNAENMVGVKALETAPTRGLLGFRSEFINDTHGEGTLVRRISGYEPYKGEIAQRMEGAMISTETGEAMTYALWNLQERGQLFISPQTPVYEGMIIGQSSKNIDLDVNPLKNKKLTAIRSSGRDEAMLLTPPKIFSLEEALEWINDDELVEVTPDAIRIRKKGLTALDRRNLYRQKMNAQ